MMNYRCRIKGEAKQFGLLETTGWDGGMVGWWNGGMVCCTE